MESVGAYEAKTHLAQLLERVQKGESITITKHGVPVAVLVPPFRAHREEPAHVIDRLKQLRTQHTLGGLSVRDLIEEGRK